MTSLNMGAGANYHTTGTITVTGVFILQRRQTPRYLWARKETVGQARTRLQEAGLES